MKSHYGFTLIELLVVIVIIGLLAGIGIASFGGSLERGKIAKAQSDLKEIKDIATAAQLASGKTLVQITGSNCSLCYYCRGLGDLRNVADTHTCAVVWDNIVTTINATGGAISGISDIKRDPWGSPYYVDENEGEYSATDCRRDFFASAGPNGTIDTYSLIDNHYISTSDDILISIPLSSTCP